MKKRISLLGVWLLVCALLFSACGGASEDGDLLDQEGADTAEVEIEDGTGADLPDSPPVRTYGVDLAGYSVQLGATRPTELREQGMELSSEAAAGVENATVESGDYHWQGTPFEVNGSQFLVEVFNTDDDTATVMDCAIYTVVWYVDLAEPTAETFINVEGYPFHYGMPGEQLEIIIDEMNYAGSYIDYDVYEADGLYYYFRLGDDGELGSLRVSILSGEETMSYR